MTFQLIPGTKGLMVATTKKSPDKTFGINNCFVKTYSQAFYRTVVKKFQSILTETRVMKFNFSNIAR